MKGKCNAVLLKIWVELWPSRSASVDSLMISTDALPFGSLSSWRSLEHILARHLPLAPWGPFILSPEKKILHYSIHGRFSFLPLMLLRWLSLRFENSKVSPFPAHCQDDAFMIMEMAFLLLCGNAGLLYIELALVAFRRLNVAK